MADAVPLLEVRRVSKRFPIRRGPLRQPAGWLHAVREVSLSVAPGQVVGLVGESGCGKTTLAKLIAHLEPPTDGAIVYQGQALGARRRLPAAIRRDIQLVFQDPTSSLDPSQRIGLALAEPLAVHRLAATVAERTRMSEKLLEQVGLPASYARRYPRELSGGERQRVAIARALTLRPRLLILDEPVASLDVSVGAKILELLARLRAETGLAYLMISHDLRVIGSMCEQVGVMYLGRLVEWAPAEELFRRPWHPYTELLLESAGLLAPPSDESQGGARDRGELPSPLQPPSGCAFRTRCPLAQVRCASDTPPLEEKSPGGAPRAEPVAPIPTPRVGRHPAEARRIHTERSAGTERVPAHPFADAMPTGPRPEAVARWRGRRVACHFRP